MARARSTPSITREDVSGLTAEKKEATDTEEQQPDQQVAEAHQEALDKGYFGQDAAELADAEDADSG